MPTTTLTAKANTPWPIAGGSATMDVDAELAGIAVEPDGKHVWIVDSQSITGDGTNKIAVYQLEVASGKALLKVDITPDKDTRLYSDYIALETNPTDPNKVVRVWLSNQAGSRLYYFDVSAPKTVKNLDLDQAETDESKKLSKTRGLLWDSTRKVLWVANEGTHCLQAIDDTAASPKISTTHVPPTTTPLSKIAKLAISAGDRVWFTQYGKNKETDLDFWVGYYDIAQKTITRIQIVGSDSKRGEYPYGITVSKDGKQIWFVTRNGLLWAIPAADTAIQSTKPEIVTDFGQGSLPFDLTIDRYGYLWVLLDGKVAEIDPAGKKLLGVYEPGGTRPLFYAIAYLSDQDGLLITDQNNQARSLLLLPADWRDPTAPADDQDVEGWTFAVDPPSGNAAPGDTFDKWTITIKNKKDALLTKDTPILLSVDSPSRATIDVPEKKAVGGKIEVGDLKALDEKGAFKVYAAVRGRRDPVLLYTGEVISLVTAIEFDEEKETIPLKGHFTPLHITVTPAEAGIPVQLEIKGTTTASFSDAVAKTQTSGITVADGKLTVPLYTAPTGIQATPGKFTVTATAGKQSDIADRVINPVPDKINMTPDSQIHMVRGRTTKDTITVTVTGQLEGSDIPLPNEDVIVVLEIIKGDDGAGIDALRFIPKDNSVHLTDPKQIGAQTDAAGQVKLGSKIDDYAIHCPAAVEILKITAYATDTLPRVPDSVPSITRMVQVGPT